MWRDAYVQHFGEPEVNVRDSVGCYQVFTDFLYQAVEEARRDPGSVTLHVASAPELSLGLLEEVTRIIEPALEHFASVVHYHRLRRFRDIPRKHSTRYFHATEESKVKLWLTIPERYFHAKWLAIEKEGELVKLLLTSANLTYDHLRGPEREDEQSYNSMVRLNIEQPDFTKNFERRMKHVYGHYLYSTDTGLRMLVNTMLPSLSAFDQYANHGIFKPEEIYGLCDDFLFEVCDAVKEDESREQHTVFIVSSHTFPDTLENKLLTLPTEVAVTVLQQSDFPQPVLDLPEERENIRRVRIPRFHCKFLAHVAPNAEDVQILMTSANFNSTHIVDTATGNYINLDWVSKLEISREAWGQIHATLGLDDTEDR